MIGQLKKAALTAAFVTLAPVASLVTGNVSDAQAHTYVSGSISFGSPVAVVGFSYGNPYLYGPVYDSPELCDVGPVYYYPTYGVYAPYYSSFRYYAYSAPRYYYPHRHYGYGPGPYAIRGHAAFGGYHYDGDHRYYGGDHRYYGGDHRYYGGDHGSRGRYSNRGHGHGGRTVNR